MVLRSYLKYVGGESFGVICSGNGGNALVRRRWADKQGGGGGEWVAYSCCLEDVLIWDTRRASLVGRLKCKPSENESAAIRGGQTTCVVLSDDGKIAAVGYSTGFVRLFNASAPYEERVALAGHSSSISALRFNPGGVILVSGAADGAGVLWDTVAERGLRRLKGHKGRMTDALFVPSSSSASPKLLLTSSQDTLVKVWDVDTGHCLQTVVGHRSEVRALDIDSEGSRVVTGSSDGEVRVWSVLRNDITTNEGGEVLNFLGLLPRKSKERTSRVRFGGGDGRLLIVAQVHGFELYQQATGKEAARRRKKRARRKKVAAENPEAVVGMNGTVTTDAVPYATDEFKHIELVLVDGRLKHLDVCGDKVLVSLGNNTLQVYAATAAQTLTTSPSYSCECKLELYGHRSDVRVVTICEDNSMVFATAGGHSLKVWKYNHRAASGLVTAFQHIASISVRNPICMAFLPGCSHLVVGGKEGTLVVVRVSTGEITSMHENAHNGCIWSLDVRPDGSALATAGADGLVKLWDLDIECPDGALTHTRTLKASEDVLSVRYSRTRSSSKRFIAVALLDHTVKVFHEDSLRFFLSLYGHSLPALSIDISDDGALLASGGADRTLKLWGLDFGDCHRSLIAHEDSITSVKFLPKTHQVITASRDGTIMRWDGDTFERIQIIGRHQSEVWSLCASHDGGFILTSGHDRSIRLWTRSSELVFPSEETEKEAEAAYDKDEEDRAAAFLNGVVDASEEAVNAASLPGKRTTEAVTAGERLLEALEIFSSERERLNQQSSKAEGIATQPNPLLLGLSPIPYLLRALQKIGQANLEQALLVLPFSKVLPFLEALVEILQLGTDVELCVRCGVFLLRAHLARLCASGMASPVRLLCEAMRVQLEDAKDRIGINMAALKMLQKYPKTS